MRLLLDVTAHGFGHLSQCAPVIAALRQSLAEPLELVVRSGLPRKLLETRLGPLTAHVPSDTDFGMVMTSPFEVDCPASIHRYRELHARLDAEIGDLTATLKTLRCDAVLSNISYITPAAASRANLPSVVFSSLTWHEILEACVSDSPATAEILAEIRVCYSKATSVLRLRPGTPFDGLVSTEIVRPIARLGRNRRAELAAELAIAPDRPVALLAFGGMLPPERPPLVGSPGEFALIGPAAWACGQLTSIESMSMAFDDLIASVDIVISKPGYGIVTEIACANTPSVLVARPGWPEEPFLVQWLRRSARCVQTGSLTDVTPDMLRACLGLPRPSEPRPVPGGEIDVANAMLAVIGAAGEAAPRVDPPTRTPVVGPA